MYMYVCKYRLRVLIVFKLHMTMICYHKNYRPLTARSSSPRNLSVLNKRTASSYPKVGLLGKKSSLFFLIHPNILIFDLVSLYRHTKCCIQWLLSSFVDFICRHWRADKGSCKTKSTNRKHGKRFEHRTEVGILSRSLGIRVRICPHCSLAFRTRRLNGRCFEWDHKNRGPVSQ